MSGRYHLTAQGLSYRFRRALRQFVKKNAQKNADIQQNKIIYHGLTNVILGADDLLRRMMGEASPMNHLAFSEALIEIWQYIDKVNKYIEESAPWTLSKLGRNDELKFVMACLAEALKIISQTVWSFMPATGEAIWAQLGIPGKPNDAPFKENTWGFFEKGGKIAKGTSLFPRIEVKK